MITSANLTETAFTKRREIGVLLDATESADTINVFESWWNDLAADVSDDAITKWEKCDSPSASEHEGVGLATLWPLPQPPNESLFLQSERGERDFAGYRNFLKHYQEFAQQYEAVQRMWVDAPLYLETDAFLNYLFHDAEGTPSFDFYVNRQPRKLGKAERGAEIAMWVPKFAAWVNRSDDVRWRERYSELVQRLLAKDRIDDLTLGDAKEVVDCLNCMNARKLNKYKFLNPSNNHIDAIQKAWKTLLHSAAREEERMQECNDALRFFGTSSVQELLGWFYPRQYPIRNNNSDAGLRFFGFGV
jgi:hypothetical protein